MKIGKEDEGDATPSGGASRRGKRTRDPEKTKRRILAAAEAEFARKGYDGSRLRDVAEVAGVHHALLHHYFGDKAGLYRAVVERAFTEVSSQATALLASRETVEALLERYVDALVTFHVESPGLVRILYLASLDEASPAYEVCRELTATFLEPLLERMAEVVEKSQRAGKVRDDVDARRLVALCLGAVSFLFYEDRFFGAYLGADVRSPEATAAHRDAAIRFLRAAVLPDG